MLNLELELSSPSWGGWVGPLAARVLLVVVSALQTPEVGFHGTFAVRSVFLGVESGDVGVNLGHVLLTCFDRCGDSTETLTDKELVDGRRCGALCFVTEIDAVAGVGLCSGHAVGSQKHLLAGVLSVLTRF